ncbi:MAG: NAD(P)-dependent oxidoreductase [Caldilineaceae bacterium]
MTQKILITGMSGLIGGIARSRLQNDFQLSALNRSEVTGVPCHCADIEDLAAIQPAFTGIDVVVHLAANARGGATWEELHRANVTGIYNVFEAARRAGVQRVIYASSGSTITGWEKEEPYAALVAGRYDEVGEQWPLITHTTPTRPSGIYGATKVWGEALARHFTDTTDLSILCVRIGHVTRSDRPESMRDFSAWCSHRDIGQMIERCVNAPADLKFDIFFALSNNKWGYRDLAHPRERVGFVPQDAAEAYR